VPAEIRIAAAALETYVATLFAKAGAAPDIARAAGEGLVAANLAGHDSHGVVRVPRYLENIGKGWLDPTAKMSVVRENGAVVVVDGNRGFGQYVGREAMDLGIATARQHGVCLIAIRRSHHLGRIGEWAERCAAAGLVSLHFVNVVHAGALAAPFGGKERRSSTNPLSIGVPVARGEPIILDMATTQVAEGKVLVALNAGKQVPAGALIDAAGRETRNPADLYASPPGALKYVAEHKGSGLALMIDLLAGALTGGGANQPAHSAGDGAVNNMLSIVIDPAAIGEGSFPATEAKAFIDWVLSCAPVDPAKPVLVPGDPERLRRKERLAAGLPLDGTTWGNLVAAGRSLQMNDAEIARLAGV
jgi:uncharacterized oxidoreductase